LKASLGWSGYKKDRILKESDGIHTTQISSLDKQATLKTFGIIFPVKSGTSKQSFVVICSTALSKKKKIMCLS
jgi:hypothetical protein